MAVAVVDHIHGHRDGLGLAVANDGRFRLVGQVARVGDLADDVVARLGGVLLQTAAAGVDLVSAVGRVRSLAPACTVVVLVPWVDDEIVGALSVAGAGAVISTDAPLTAVLDALLLGHGADAAEFSPMADERAQRVAELLRITQAELVVLRRLADGAPPQLIAHELHRSIDTIRDHIRALRRKLDCSTAVELVVTAYRSGLLPGLGRPVPKLPAVRPQ